jgi:hypothetical protein
MKGLTTNQQEVLDLLRERGPWISGPAGKGTGCGWAWEYKGKPNASETIWQADRLVAKGYAAKATDADGVITFVALETPVEPLPVPAQEGGSDLSGREAAKLAADDAETQRERRENGTAHYQVRQAFVDSATEAGIAVRVTKVTKRYTEVEATAAERDALADHALAIGGGVGKAALKALAPREVAA